MTHLASDVSLRAPQEADWPAILEIANRSVQDVPGAGSQEEWLRNRRRPWPLRRHMVAVEGASVVGYAAAESHFEQAENGYRLFVVASPGRLLDVGALLYEQLDSLLSALRASEAWFIEYAADRRICAFLRERGFAEARSFCLDDGVGCVVLSRRTVADAG